VPWNEHPLADLHRTRSSMNAAADCYEADYWAEQEQAKADADEAKCARQSVSYYVRDAVLRLRERDAAARAKEKP